MILDSSRGNLFREPEPKPSNQHHLREEDTEGQIILDSSAPDPFFPQSPFPSAVEKLYLVMIT